MGALISALLAGLVFGLVGWATMEEEQHAR